jgi:beta-barrel assembly-enhancing protease
MGSRRQFMLAGGACALCAARADVLPTDLQPLIDASYEPVDADERGMWQSIERIEEIVETSPQRLNSPELLAYTRSVTERLVGRPVPELRIYVMRDAAFNASMFPSGMMIVNTGLMARVHNEAQYAAVLGHEAGHYFRKHSIGRYRDARRKSAVAAFIGIAAGVAGGGGWMDVAYGINTALMMSVLRFSRDHEMEADAYGITLMARCGYRPHAASQIWKQLIEERRASSEQRNQKYRDPARSAFSTHPPGDERMTDLADTAHVLAGANAVEGTDRQDEWSAVIAPYRAMLLEEQVRLNDPGASLYLVNGLAKQGWTGLLRYNEGEIYRMRAAPGDDARAAEAYAAAAALPDAPAEAWRAHGYALVKAGKKAEGHEALGRYLTLKPDANDAAMIRFTLAQ